jgi:hypothetical protein
MAQEQSTLLLNLVRTIRLKSSLRAIAAIDPALEWARGHVVGLSGYLGRY